MYKEIIFIENYLNIKDLFIIIFGYTFVYCITGNIGYGMHCGLGDGGGVGLWGPVLFAIAQFNYQ